MYKEYKRLIYTPPDLLARMCKVSSNDLAAYIAKNQPQMTTVTGVAIRNCIFHSLKGCNGKQATFSNGKRNASHFSRTLFDVDVLSKLDEGNNLCYTTIKANLSE